MPKRRLKEFEHDGEKWVFRIPEVDDVWAVLGKMPTLPDVTKEGPDESGFAKFKTLSRNADLAIALLVKVAVAPKLLEDSAVEVAPGTFPAREIPYVTRMEWYAFLTRESGFSEEAAERMRPFSETGEDSSTSTGSDSATDAPRPVGSPA